MKQQNILGVILGVVTLTTSGSFLDVKAISLEEGYAKAQAAEISSSIALTENILLAQGGGGPRFPQPPNQDAARGQINQLYRLILNRAPDDFGMNYYLGRYSNDRWTMEQIRQELFNSDEARRIREQAISQANNGRNGDRRDGRYENRNGNRYESRNDNYYDNRDNVRYQINQSYRRILNRNADDFGINYYLERYYNDRWSLDRIREDIWSSDEARSLRGW
jgi:hypothetical protein